MDICASGCVWTSIQIVLCSSKRLRGKSVNFKNILPRGVVRGVVNLFFIIQTKRELSPRDFTRHRVNCGPNALRVKAFFGVCFY